MNKQIVMAACALMLIASPIAAQTGNDKPKTAEQVSKDVATTQAIKQKVDESQFGPRFDRSLTNVQIEFNLTDQTGTQTPEKKTVSMIVSSGNWGKIRSSAQMLAIGDVPSPVVLNIDARPLISMEGHIQLEMTLVYEPVKAEGEARRPKSSGLNQSQTVVLTSGKPLIVSQAADPVTDRKVVIEVKATVLK